MEEIKEALPQTALAGGEWIASQDVSLWLTGEERQRWQAFTSDRRRTDWLAGRMAAKRLLRDTWGIAPRDCPIGSDGTAPIIGSAELESINFSLSHSMGQGAVSWARTATQGSVGIDLQQIRPVHPGLTARLLTEDEQRQKATIEDSLLLFWALKEAAIKARRLAWGRAMREIVVTLGPPGEALIALPGEIHPFTARYRRLEGAWLARVLRPQVGSGERQSNPSPSATSTMP